MLQVETGKAMTSTRVIVVPLLLELDSIGLDGVGRCVEQLGEVVRVLSELVEFTLGQPLLLAVGLVAAIRVKVFNDGLVAEFQEADPVPRGLILR